VPVKLHVLFFISIPTIPKYRYLTRNNKTIGRLRTKNFRKPPKRKGIIAPPAIATTSSEDAVSVFEPSPDMAIGQIEGQIKAFAKPNKAIKVTAINPLVYNDRRVNAIPKLK